MKYSIEPLVLAILFLVVFVTAGLFITFSFLLHKENESLRKQLGDKVFEWLTKQN